jgi:hypothetical protein
MTKYNYNNNNHNSYIDRHFRHYPDNLWLIRLFLILFVDIIYFLLIFIFTIEKSNTYLSIFLVIIPLQSTYIHFIYYLKPFYRNFIFVGLITIYCFMSKIIMSFLLFQQSNFLIIVYLCMTLEMIFYFIWLSIGMYNEIRYQKLLDISKNNCEMENLIV